MNPKCFIGQVLWLLTNLNIFLFLSIFLDGNKNGIIQAEGSLMLNVRYAYGRSLLSVLRVHFVRISAHILKAYKYGSTEQYLR